MNEFYMLIGKNISIASSICLTILILMYFGYLIRLQYFKFQILKAGAKKVENVLREYSKIKEKDIKE